MRTKILLLLLVIKLAVAHNIEQCFSIASRHYQIPVKLLKAIAKTETRFDHLAMHINANRSYDIGIMQINSTWLNKLRRVDINEAELFDGCKNIQIGAWILAQNIQRYGFTARAIGAYNASTPQLRQRYALLVMHNME